jgi:aryl-alcohol dehydrogenase-like predicted oxidoreductase
MVWSPLAGGFLSGKKSREIRKAKCRSLNGFDTLPFDRGYELITTSNGELENRYAAKNF